MIEFKKGTTRFVVLVGNKAIKFPIMRPYYALRSFKQTVKRKMLWYSLWVYDYQMWGTFWNYMFEGIMTNLNEYLIYKKYKSPLLVPTRFTFFGLFNIQDRVKTLDEGEAYHVLHSMRQIDENDAFMNGHIYDTGGNFTKVNDNFAIVDYGEKGYILALLRHKDKIAALFLKK